MIDLERLEENARKLVTAAEKAGADQCDVTVARSDSQSVSVREGRVENTGRSENDDFSLRVFIGKRVASVSANQPSDFEVLAERAVSMAKVSPEDPWAGLPDPDRLASDIPDIEMLDETVPETEILQAQALEAENAGTAVPGVAKSMGASAAFGKSGFVLATSDGFSGNFARSRFMISASMLSGEGESMERDYDFTSAVYFEDLRPADVIGKEAGERAVRRSNPQKVKTGKYPVIIDRRVAGGMLATMLGAANAAAVARKTSFWREKLGDQVAAKSITVHDNPLLDRGLGSRPFDGEGIGVAPLVIIEEGVLKTWLLDSATARELSLETNARAARNGAGISPSSTNAWLDPGERSIEEMAREIGTGLYVTETIGHGVNMVTGDYSKGASGFWIEGGEITYPVSEITIAGNLIEMFKAMHPLRDLEFRGSVNAPSLLINGMTIGGN